MTQSDNKFTFYNDPVCPFGMRAWLAIEFKKVNYNLIWVDITNKSKEFSLAYSKALGHDPNSDGKVPILDYNGKLITESTIVCRYLDYIIPTQPFYPKDPIKRVYVDLGIELALTVAPRFFGIIRAKPETLDTKIKELKTVFKKVNDGLLQSSKDGPYLIDNQITLFESVCFPFVDRCKILYEYWDSKINDLKMSELLKDCPRLKQWYNKLISHQSVIKMFEELQKQTNTEYTKHWINYYTRRFKNN